MLIGRGNEETFWGEQCFCIVIGVIHTFSNLQGLHLSFLGSKRCKGGPMRMMVVACMPEHRDGIEGFSHLCW